MAEETPSIAPEIEETPVTIVEEAVAESVAAEKTEEPQRRRRARQQSQKENQEGLQAAKTDSQQSPVRSE